VSSSLSVGASNAELPSAAARPRSPRARTVAADLPLAPTKMSVPPAISPRDDRRLCSLAAELTGAKTAIAVVRMHEVGRSRWTPACGRGEMTA